MQLLTAEQLLKSIGKENGQNVLAWLQLMYENAKLALVNSSTFELDQGKAKQLDKMISDLRTLLSGK